MERMIKPILIPEFNEDLHEYRIEGRKVPSVSEIISGIGLNDFSHVQPDVLLAKQKIGTAVHHLSHLYDSNNLAKCSEDLMPWLESYKQFRSKFPMSLMISEVRLASKKYKFAGRLDRVFIIENRKGILVDLKTGDKNKSHNLQKAGYKILVEENYPIKLKELWTYYIKPGGFSESDIDKKIDISDDYAFLSALNVYNWKYNNKLIK